MDYKQLMTNDYPWLLLKMNGIQYAVYSKNIAAIVHISDDITVVPDEDEVIRGIMSFREKPIKLIDMRVLLSIESIEVEFNAFKEMIDERKKDHEEWIEALNKSISNGTKFEKATDPHKCKLGIWLDSFETKNNTISYQLNQIRDPHRELHETAIKIFECNKKHEECERAECLKVTIDRAEAELVPEILQLLDETKVAFKSIYREMAIVFEEDDNYFAIIVDEVLSVDSLHFMDGATKASKMFATKYIFGVGKTQKSDALVLLLNEKKLAEVCQEIDDSIEEKVSTKKVKTANNSQQAEEVVEPIEPIEPAKPIEVEQSQKETSKKKSTSPKKTKENLQKKEEATKQKTTSKKKSSKNKPATKKNNKK